MLQQAKELRRLWSTRPEFCFGRLNFHRPDPIDAAAKRLASDAPPAVLVLSGEDGTGRGYVCEAIGQRARETGRSVDVWHLDLDGFEPDIPNPLERFLDHLLTLREGIHGTRQLDGLDTLVSVAKALTRPEPMAQGTEWAAAILSLLFQLVQLDGRAESLAKLIVGWDEGREPESERGEHELLREVLAERTADRRLLIHVRAPEHLTEQLRQWLIHEAERHPERYLLVLACHPDDVTRDVASTAQQEPTRIDLEPLTLDELREILADRFGQSAFSDMFSDDDVQALHEASRGRPAALAALVADRLDEEGNLSPRSAPLPPADLYESLDARLRDAGEVGDAVRELLFRAVLCGESFPAAPILEQLQVSEEVGEAALDFLDDVLVEEMEWLQDLEFRHPSFPGFSLYAFRHPLLERAILDQLSDLSREMHAITLLRFLENRLPSTRRGVAQLFLSITSPLEPKYREFYARQLAWWIGRDSADALRVEARRAMEKGEVDPVMVWRMVTTSDRWPPFRRLALLDACGEARSEEGEPVLTFDQRTDYHLLRAQLLLQVGRFDEAREEAEKAAVLCEDEPLLHGRSVNIRGLAHLQTGKLEDAARDFESAHEELAAHVGPHHGATLGVLNNWATTLEALGRPADAARIYRAVVEVCEQLFGVEHPDTLTARNNLAQTLFVQGDLEAAEPLQRSVLEASEQLHGDDHPNTLKARSNLASTLFARGDLASALNLQGAVLEGSERVLGPRHPNTTFAAWNLFNTLTRLGDVDKAQALFESHLRRLLRDDVTLSRQEQQIRQFLLEQSRREAP